ncbi:MAG: CHASE2 domain-containing protein, partial [candidate division WOR-3 bacterium]
MAPKEARILKTKYFGLIIGAVVFLLLLLVSTQTVLFANLEQRALDFNFRLKNIVRRTRVQEGVTVEQRSSRLSGDILIIGIDDKSLDVFGRWPFPRFTHANLINSLTRIKDQNERERALFLDILFSEPSEPAHDALLVERIRENGRVFLGTILER